MKARDLVFSASPDMRAARAFVVAHHYSRTCPPSQFFFDATFAGALVGVCVFRKPSLPKVAACYGADIELVRLYLHDTAEKNAESRFIGWCLRQLKKQRAYSRCISYADPRAGHQGTIYRAANFEYAGTERGHGTRRIVVDGHEWHSKSAFDKWGCSGARLKALLPGSTVEIIVCPPKHVYLFPKCGA